MMQHFDLVKGRYLVLGRNILWCIDGTFIESGVVLLVMDLSSRQILGHSVIAGVTGNGFNAEHVIELLKHVLESRNNPTQLIVHSDRGAQFKSKEYHEFCKKYMLHKSLGQGPFSNQAIERCNRTFKEKLVYLLQLRFDNTTLTLKDLCILSHTETSHLVFKAVELYNQEPHKEVYELSPNHADTALGTIDIAEISGTNSVVISKKGSQEGAAIEAIKARVIERYAGDWGRFFLEWRDQSSREFEEARRDRERQYRLSLELKEENAYLREQIDFLVATAKKEAQKIAEREEIRRKRKEAKRQQPRDNLSSDVFFATLKEETYISPLVKARIRVALTFLYLTGLRISNLLLFTVGNCKNFVGKNRVLIPLIKKGVQYF